MWENIEKLPRNIGHTSYAPAWWIMDPAAWQTDWNSWKGTTNHGSRALNRELAKLGDGFPWFCFSCIVLLLIVSLGSEF